jgi:hypothetical protein
MLISKGDDSTDIADASAPPNKSSPRLYLVHAVTIQLDQNQPQQPHNGFKNISIRSADVRASQYPRIGAVPLRARVGDVPDSCLGT